MPSHQTSLVFNPEQNRLNMHKHPLNSSAPLMVIWWRHQSNIHATVRFGVDAVHTRYGLEDSMSFHIQEGIRRWNHQYAISNENFIHFPSYLSPSLFSSFQTKLLLFREQLVSSKSEMRGALEKWRKNQMKNLNLSLFILLFSYNIFFHDFLFFHETFSLNLYYGIE